MLKKKITIILAIFTVIVQINIVNVQAEEAWDPAEDVNRSIFDFNNFIDRNVLEPVADGYDYIMPSFARKGVSNFIENLGYPSYLVSDLVQLKFSQVASHTGRFLTNSTVGLLGFFDVATDFGLPHHEEDFASALAYNGVPAGPYLMVPLLGPSNARDLTGRVVDMFLDPVNWLAYSDYSTSTKVWVPVGYRVFKTIHQRADLIDAVNTAKESSLDYYLFVQSAYYQYRDGVVNDGKEED